MTMTSEPSTEYTTEVQRIRGLEMPWNRGLSTDTAGSVQGLNPWHPQEFLVECVETVRETDDMMTIVFRRADGLPLASSGPVPQYRFSGAWIGPRNGEPKLFHLKRTDCSVDFRHYC